MSRIPRAWAKSVIGGCVRALPPLQRRLTRGLTVFLFHDVTDEPSGFARDYDLAVSLETFRRQTAWITDHYQVVHPESLASGRKLPENAAVITFDDGFRGAFENGLPILEERNLPSIVFLNMRSIVEQRPLIAALVAHLERFVPAFVSFAREAGACAPFHVSLTPATLARFEERFGLPDLSGVIRYQGPLADPATIAGWSSSKLVAFGSHLFDHWNAPALTEAEFVEQYDRNQSVLASYSNQLPMLAFPNGRFTAVHLQLLRERGAAKAFSSSGGVPRDPGAFLLDRCSLYQSDSDDTKLWFRALRAASITAWSA